MSLKITALEYTEVKISEQSNNFSTVNMSYSVNGGGFGSYYGETIYLSQGDEVEFKNTSGTFSHTDGTIRFKLESTGKIDVSGDLASMLDGDWEEWGGQPPAINDDTQSFDHFFEGCPIVDASGLSLKFDFITTDYALSYLFSNCTYLEKGPNLDVDEINGQYCYSYMFANCEYLSEITFGYTALESSMVENWMTNAGTMYGTFYYTNPDFMLETIQWGSDSGLPGLWIPEYKPYGKEPEYFRVTVRGDSTIYVSFSIPEGFSPNVNLEYRREGEDWSYYDFINPQLWVNGGSYIEFRNTTEHFSTSEGRISLHSTGEIDVTGELYTLLNYQHDPYLDDSFYADPYAFASLLNGCDVVDAQDLKLFPRNSFRIYDSMFTNCITLTQTPTVDFSIQTENGSYFAMFYGCTSLQNINSIDGSQYFAESACESMFANCSSLEAFYGIYTNGVGRASFANMFSGCINLTGVYNIEIRHIANATYENMFKNCAKLQSIPNFTQATDQMQTNCFKGMFEGCTSLTAMPNLPSTNLSESCYERMFADCTGITEITMNDATRQPNCYKEMFDGCTLLNNITFGAKSLSESYNENWLRNVSPTGTFSYTNKEFKASAAPRSPSGIPVGWSIKSLVPRDKISFELNGNFVNTFSIAGKNVMKMLLNDQLIYKVSYLPKGYIELVYAQKNVRNQGVDIGIKISDKYQCQIQFQFPNAGSTESWITGTWGQSPSKSDYLIGRYLTSFRAQCGSDASINYSTSIPADTGIHILGIMKDKFIVDDVVSTTYPDFNTLPSVAYSQNFTLFKSHHVDDGTSRRIYWAKFWDMNDNLVRNLIPCKDANGVVCMFDLVTKNTYYPNSGSLIAGPEA